MWSEWLVRTLRPRRERDATAPPREHSAPPPELEADGMHPGADEFRGALDRIELELES